MWQKNIGAEKALQKIKHFCAYQERNHAEVREKLYGYGLYKMDVETLLSKLIEENYLNEERYAIAFAGGKFRTRQWGRIKIKYELKKNKVSDYCIAVALKSIDEIDYKKAMKKLLESKNKMLSAETNEFIKKKKIFAFLLQKGFEPPLITDCLEED